MKSLIHTKIGSTLLITENIFFFLPHIIYIDLKLVPEIEFFTLHFLSPSFLFFVRLWERWDEIIGKKSLDLTSRPWIFFFMVVFLFYLDDGHSNSLLPCKQNQFTGYLQHPEELLWWLLGLPVFFRIRWVGRLKEEKISFRGLHWKKCW